jgi:hypothetical protein
VLVDTTDLSPDEVIELLVGTIEARIPGFEPDESGPEAAGEPGGSDR